MKISAIQSYGMKPISKSCKQLHKLQTAPPDTLNTDTVSFKGKNVVKGAGIGAIIGLGALAIISGGLAAPIAYGVYAATMGTAGGMLGHVVDKVNEENDPKNNKNDEEE